MMQKTRSRNPLIYLTLFMLALLLFPRPVRAMEARETYLSDTSVKISWTKNKKAAKYVVYRASANKPGYIENQKYRKYKTLSASSTSFTEKKLKPGRFYSYEIRAYSGKNRHIDTAGTSVYMAIAAVEWDEYQEVDVPYSPKQIQLVFQRGDGITPDGYQIWRKDLTAGEGQYKKLGKIEQKRNVDGYTYRDRTVTAMHRYKYMIRAYRKIKGKTLYGKSSSEVTMSAVRQKPVLSCGLVKPLDPKTGEIEITLKSGRNNGPLVLDKDGYCMDAYKTTGGIIIEYEFRLTAFSTDGINWTKCNKQCTLTQNSTLYLRFTLDQESLKYAGEIKKNPIIYTFDSAVYNGLSNELMIQPVRGKAAASLNGELYH